MNTSHFFKSLFENAEHNCILILDMEGNIKEANNAFVNNFGYPDIVGKNFSMLFSEQDQSMGKPQKELAQVKSKGCASDDNYLVNSAGQLVWVSGESVLVTNAEEGHFIVKVIQNIQAQKQLERFLIESGEFLEGIFESINDRALLIMDNMMRILKVNTAFIKMFELETPVKEQSRLTDIQHAFWKNDGLRTEIRSFIVKNRPIKEDEFTLQTRSGETKKVSVATKVLYIEPSLERKILLMIKENE